LHDTISPLLVGCVAQLAERRSLAGELTLTPSATGQPTRPTQPFILPKYMVSHVHLVEADMVCGRHRCLSL